MKHTLRLPTHALTKPQVTCTHTAQRQLHTQWRKAATTSLFTHTWLHKYTHVETGQKHTPAMGIQQHSQHLLFGSLLHNFWDYSDVIWDNCSILGFFSTNNPKWCFNTPNFPMTYPKLRTPFGIIQHKIGIIQTPFGIFYANIWWKGSCVYLCFIHFVFYSCDDKRWEHLKREAVCTFVSLFLFSTLVTTISPSQRIRVRRLFSFCLLAWISGYGFWEMVRVWVWS